MKRDWKKEYLRLLNPLRRVDNREYKDEIDRVVSEVVVKIFEGCEVEIDLNKVDDELLRDMWLDCQSCPFETDDFADVVDDFTADEIEVFFEKYNEEYVLYGLSKAIIDSYDGMRERNTMFAPNINLCDVLKSNGVVVEDEIIEMDFSKRNLQRLKCSMLVSSFDKVTAALEKKREEENRAAMVAKFKQLLGSDDKAPRTLSNRFGNDYNEDDLKRVFERLVEQKFLANDSDVEAWLFYNGVDVKKTIDRKLNWIGSNRQLAYLIGSLYSRNVKKWAITQRAFLINDEEIADNVLKSAYSKMINDLQADGLTDKYKLDKIIKELINK